MSEFSSLVGISVGIAGFAITIKTWLINARIKKYNEIIKKAEKTWYNSIVSKNLIKYRRSFDF